MIARTLTFPASSTPCRRSGLASGASAVVKLFTPDVSCTWLLTDLDPDDEGIAFGLCDLGMGFPELGTVSITELASIRGLLGLPVERDLEFIAQKTLSSYADEAVLAGGVRA